MAQMWAQMGPMGLNGPEPNGTDAGDQVKMNTAIYKLIALIEQVCIYNTKCFVHAI